MGSRIELQTVLEGIVTPVFFQPPPSAAMTYPCIVYQLDDVNTNYANNLPYSHKKGYMITVIDPDPDSSIPDSIGELESAKFDRFYTADNLNHFVFTLYF